MIRSVPALMKGLMRKSRLKPRMLPALNCSFSQQGTVIEFTGPPGVGKSYFCSIDSLRMLQEWNSIRIVGRLGGWMASGVTCLQRKNNECPSEKEKRLRA